MRVLLIFLSFFYVQESFAQHVHSEAVKKEEPRVTIEVPSQQQARIGLKTSKIVKKTVAHTIRTVGAIVADERKEAHIHTKVSGWIENIHADYVGKEITKGGPLFDLYAPELVSTQEEFLAARKQKGVGKELAQAALDRLRLWGVPTKEIEKLKKKGKSSRTITFESPLTGFVISKNAIQGMYITPGLELYQIADLSTVWIVITLYEFDVAIIKLGDEVEVSLPYDPKAKLNGKISYISPSIDLETRTAKGRIEVDNKNQNLKPGMYVNVSIKKELGESIVVPDDAVIDTGTRKIVFVKSGEVQFDPREVKIGPRVEGEFIILSGLKAGEEVVTGAHFLIDAESKIKAATQKDSSAPSGHGGH